jgi:hypothetical protein
METFDAPEFNPRMTITDAEGPHWLVSFDHDFGHGMHVALRVRVSKSEHPLGMLQEEAFDRASELLEAGALSRPERELKHPLIIINNAPGQHWLVRFEHEFDDDESIVFSVKVLKSRDSLPKLEQQAIAAARGLLDEISKRASPFKDE